MGLVFLTSLQYGIYQFDDGVGTKTWEASASIESEHVSHSWDATESNSFTEGSLLEVCYVSICISVIKLWHSQVTLEPIFETNECYQDFTNYYGVMRDADQVFYIISQDYFADGRNNLNLSQETWERDFDCAWTYNGWHTIIPFYETDAEYTSVGLRRTNMYVRCIYYSVFICIIS